MTTSIRFKATAYCLVAISLVLGLHPLTGRAEDIGLTEKNMQQPVSDREENVAGGKWLPIPMFLTEPAIGYGLGMSLGYIHAKKEKVGTEPVSPLQTPKSVLSADDNQKPPPTITGIAAGYTRMGTWFGAVGHTTSWRSDTIRYTGLLAYADIRSTYYILDHPFDFSLRGTAFYQGLKVRLGSSDFFFGGKLMCLKTTSEFETTVGDTHIALGDISSQDVGLAAEASFDGRDNVFTPNKGQLLQIAAWYHGEAIGGDYNYWESTFKASSFHPLSSKMVIGLRLEVSAVDGRPPFFAYPWVTLRGIPAMRYQGKCVGMAEVEGRWNLLPRWAVIGFLGKGGVSGGGDALQTRDNMVAGGAGLRYLFMPEEGLWLGMDAARGPEQWYTYVIVGSAF